ncbi:MAG: hypothetical protein R2759_19765 [Bacteroidales bacterium]
MKRLLYASRIPHFIPTEKSGAKIGNPLPKYESIETALGKRPFVNDLCFEGMLFGVLKFSEYPRATIIKIDLSEAEKQEGVIRIFSCQRHSW